MSEPAEVTPPANLADRLFQQITADQSDGGAVDVSDMFSGSGRKASPEKDAAPPVEDAPSDTGNDAPAGDDTPKKNSKKVAEAVSVEDFLKIVENESAESGKDEDPAESDSDDDEIPEEVAKQGDKAKATWGDLKKKAKEADRLLKENAELKAKVETSPDASKEVEELRNQLAESQKYIFAHNVTQSDEYRQAILEPMQRIEARVKNLASDDETALEIISALSEPNERLRTEKLAEVAEGMGEYHRSKLAGIESDLDRLFDKKEELFARSEQAGQEIERNKLASKAQESEKDKLAREAAADQVWKNVVKQLPFMTDEDGKVLDEFKEVQELGRAGINPNNSIGTQAFAGYATQLVPKMATLLQKNADKIQELESAISALKGSSPSINNSSHQKPAKDNRPLSEIVMDRIAADSGF